jgi:hypothetical protein
LSVTCQFRGTMCDQRYLPNQRDHLWDMSHRLASPSLYKQGNEKESKTSQRLPSAVDLWNPIWFISRPTVTKVHFPDNRTVSLLQSFREIRSQVRP